MTIDRRDLLRRAWGGLIAWLYTQKGNKGSFASIDGRAFSPPDELGWPASCNGKSVPQKVRLLKDRYVTRDVDPKSLVASAIWNVQPYYVNASMPDDFGDGRTPQSAKQSIASAIRLSNDDRQPAGRLYVAHHPEGYSRTLSINGPLGDVEPLKPMALIAIGGRVRHFCGTTESFPTSVDSTFAHSFIGGPSSAVRVFDRLDTDESGLYTELDQVAGQTECEENPNSWTTMAPAAAIQIHRADGLRPTLLNTLICRDFDVALLRNTSADLYVQGFDFEGGDKGGLTIRKANSARNVVLLDCTFRYAGSQTSQFDGLRVVGVAGLVFIDTCDSSANWKDGFNFHGSNISQMHVMGLNLTGWKNGKAPATSCNFLTGHETTVSFFAGGHGGLSVSGADVHFINSSKTYIVGMRITAGSFGGSLTGCFRASGRATMWLENCVAESPSTSVAAVSAGAVVYCRNLKTTSGGTVELSGGLVTIF
jgi:hypothetical protein